VQVRAQASSRRIVRGNHDGFLAPVGIDIFLIRHPMTCS
jgi:hypothetical protein